MAAASLAVFLLGMGEELWKKFLPKYLESLGAGPVAVGLFGTLKDFFDAVYQYPGGWLADRVGRRRAFLLFIAMATSMTTLVAAFIIGGLREIGEPARKAMIVDFAEPHLRARTVGLYYLVRSLTVTPAAAIGGLLWTASPQAPFIIAGIVGIIGMIVFATTVEERYAS